MTGKSNISSLMVKIYAKVNGDDIIIPICGTGLSKYRQ